MEPLTEAFVIPDSVLGPRDVVVVEGPDALSYLQSQVSQDLRASQVGGSTWTLVLEPTGKVDGLARVDAHRPTNGSSSTPTPASAADLLARLDRFKIGSRSTTALDRRPATSTRRRATSRSGSSSGGRRWGTRSCRARRSRQGTGSSRIAVSFTKGCYPGPGAGRADGQPWRRGAAVAAPARRAGGLAAGDPVLDGDQAVGEVTSVVLARAALAWVKRASDIGEPVASC